MLRIGHGYDLHQVTKRRCLYLGGMIVPWDSGLLGHSDADVLLHAIMDAILGALALGDIGHWFPETDPTYRGISSKQLLSRIMSSDAISGWHVVNLDTTVLAEEPKLAPHIWSMRQSIAALLGVDKDQVSVKATTAEGTGPIGRGEAIAAHAVVLMGKGTGWSG